MPISVRSFAKINIGLCIGARRDDGFHDLCTVYQTLSLHDTIRVDVRGGTGIEIRSKDPRVPDDESNTCWRVADRVLKTLKTRGKVVISIEKQLPVQGGLGAASSNGVATMLGLERALKAELTPEQRLRIASEVGSDLPLFLLGGTVLGVGRGEQVYPLEDRAPQACVVVTPKVGVSTPQAFADWDAAVGEGLTASSASDRISSFSRSVFTWLRPTAGVPANGKVSGGRAETPLLDLVRAGIENDFERVVFPKYPELRELKRALEREGAKYASLSGSGSTLYGLFETSVAAEEAASRIRDRAGVDAFATRTQTRDEYWQHLFG